MNYAAVVLDLDGTLLNSGKQISDRNYNAVLACHEKGIRIIFATARPPRSVIAYLPEELLEMGSFVYYNGAQVSCRLSAIELYEEIEAGIAAEVMDHCLENCTDIDLSLEVRDNWYCLREVDYSVMMNVKGNPVVKPLEELKRYNATKILVTGQVDVPLLQAKFGSRLNIILTDNGDLLQIMSANASKEAAVAGLCSRLGIPLEKVIVFGDDFNDAGIFKISGHSVAMGNAIEELKQLADEITETNDNDGVALVLEKLI